MTTRIFSVVIVCLLLLSLLGCGAEPEVPAVSYQCLPSGEEAAWETVMDAAISGVAEAAGREDGPVDFMTRYHGSSGNWVVTLIYAGGDLYNVNLDSASAEVHTIVQLPADYLDALNEFQQAGIQASQNGALIYSREG